MAISLFGVGMLLVRETSRNKAMAAKYLGIAFTIRTCLLLTSAAIVLLLAVRMEISRPVFLSVFLAIAINSFQSYTQLLINLFQAFEKMKYEPMVIFASTISLLLGLLTVIFLDLGYLAVFLAFILAAFIRLGFVAIVAFKNFVLPKFNYQMKDLVSFLKQSAFVGLGIFLQFNLLRVDVLLLKWLRGANEVAYFQGVHSIILQLEVLPLAIMAAVFPRFSRLAAADVETLAALYNKAFKYIFIAALLIAALLFCYSEQIIILILGKKFLASITTFKVLSWSILGFFLNALFNSMIIALGKQKIMVLFAGISLLLNGLIGTLLIPQFSHQGAAAAALISYITLSLTLYSYLSISGYNVSLPDTIFKPAFAAAVATAVILVTKDISLPVSFLMGVSAFGFLLWSMGVLTVKEMIELLRKTASR